MHEELHVSLPLHYYKDSNFQLLHHSRSSFVFKGFDGSFNDFDVCNDFLRTEFEKFCFVPVDSKKGMPNRGYLTLLFYFLSHDNTRLLLAFKLSFLYVSKIIFTRSTISSSLITFETKRVLTYSATMLCVAGSKILTSTEPSKTFPSTFSGTWCLMNCQVLLFQCHYHLLQHSVLHGVGRH